MVDRLVSSNTRNDMKNTNDKYNNYQSNDCCRREYPILSQNRTYYTLGPLERECGVNKIEQPYTFPLQLNYGYWPPINTNLNTWARIP